MGYRNHTNKPHNNKSGSGTGKKFSDDTRWGEGDGDTAISHSGLTWKSPRQQKYDDSVAARLTDSDWEVVEDVDIDQITPPPRTPKGKAPKGKG